MAWETDCGAADAWFNGATASAMSSFLTRFLHANRCPPRIASGAGFRLKTLWGSRPRLPGAVDAILETSQLFGADRAAGVKFPGGDADFRAEAEFAAVGKLRRCVMQHDCRIDLVEEFARGGFVLGHDRVRVLRTVVVNMRDRFIDAVHHLRGDDGVLILGIPVFVGGRLHAGVGSLSGIVTAPLATDRKR